MRSGRRLLVAWIFGLTQTFAQQIISSDALVFAENSTTPPAVSIVYNQSDIPYFNQRNGKPSHGLVLCIWPDGRAVWSHDMEEGGPPFLTGRVDPKRLQEFLRSARAKGLFTRTSWFARGIDLPHQDANIIDGADHVTVDSSFYYDLKGHHSASPEKITNDVVLPYLRLNLEAMLPEKGTPLRDFKYELREPK